MNCSVLYITYDGLLEPLGSSQVLPYVRELAKKAIRWRFSRSRKTVLQKRSVHWKTN